MRPYSRHSFAFFCQRPAHNQLCRPNNFSVPKRHPRQCRWASSYDRRMPLRTMSSAVPVAPCSPRGAGGRVLRSPAAASGSKALHDFDVQSGTPVGPTVQLGIRFMAPFRQCQDLPSVSQQQCDPGGTGNSGGLAVAAQQATASTLNIVPLQLSPMLRPISARSGSDNCDPCILLHVGFIASNPHYATRILFRPGMLGSDWELGQASVQR